MLQLQKVRVLLGNQTHLTPKLPVENLFLLVKAFLEEAAFLVLVTAVGTIVSKTCRTKIPKRNENCKDFFKIDRKCFKAFVQISSAKVSADDVTLEEHFGLGFYILFCFLCILCDKSNFSGKATREDCSRYSS